jgi:WS/DGAT/MGAT family acyltransferase
VKAIARAHEATVNDVLLGALTGALRTYLLSRGERPSRMRAIVPVNLRPPSDAIDEELGNWFGLVFLELPVDLDDRTARLCELHGDMDRLKRSQEAPVALGLLHLLGRSPGAVEDLAERFFTAKGSLVVTNVPGPREPLSLAGHRLRDLMFWVPHPGPRLGLGVSLLSYAGAVRIGVRADTGVLADPGVIVRAFEDELEGWLH